MNRRAIKEVLLFWVYALLVSGVVALIFVLIMNNYQALGITLLVLIAVAAASGAVYQTSLSDQEKEKSKPKRKKKKV